MSGASVEHELITANLIWHTRNLLGEKSPRRPYGSNARLWVAQHRRVLHTDVSVICDPVERASESATMVTNPKVLFEVLSPDSGFYDLGRKLDWYTSIASLRGIVYVEQRSPHVRLLRRDDARSDWTLSFAAGPDDGLRIESLEITLSVASVYNGVTFPAEEEPPTFPIIR